MTDLLIFNLFKASFEILRIISTVSSNTFPVFTVLLVNIRVLSFTINRSQLEKLKQVLKYNNGVWSYVFEYTPVHVDLPVGLTGDVDILEFTLVVFGVGSSQQQLTTGLRVRVPAKIKTFLSLKHYRSRKQMPI